MDLIQILEQKIFSDYKREIERIYSSISLEKVKSDLCLNDIDLEILASKWSWNI